MGRTIGRACSWILLLIIATPMLPPQTYVSGAAPEPVWQSSMEPAVRLSVRDKYGRLGKYTAVWIVRGPTGSQYRAEVTVKQDDLKDVHFPADFRGHASPGRYSWKCFVAGREVLNGSFEFKTVVSYSDQVTVRR